jgi:hypothetical protein
MRAAWSSHSTYCSSSPTSKSSRTRARHTRSIRTMYNGTTAGADGIVRRQPNLVHVRHRCRQTGARAEKYVEWKARGTRATTRYCSSKGSSRTPVSGSQDTQWTQWTRSRLAGDTPRWPKGKPPRGEKSRRFFYGGQIRHIESHIYEYI